jgi:hypothetical protein
MDCNVPTCELHYYYYMLLLLAEVPGPGRDESLHQPAPKTNNKVPNTFLPVT